MKYQNELKEIKLKLQKSYRKMTLENEQKATNAIKKNSKFFFKEYYMYVSSKESINKLLY